jgi:hypothetical protein
MDMKITPIDPPRKFTVGTSEVKFDMKDCGRIELDRDEQVTFLTESGAEYDVARKDWGFYATPSLNGRLQGFGLRGVLICNTITGRYFVLLVESGHEASFQRYMEQESLEIVAWLDETAALDRLRASVIESK